MFYVEPVPADPGVGNLPRKSQFNLRGFKKIFFGQIKGMDL